MKLEAKDLRIGNLVKYDNREFSIHTIAKEFPTLDTTEFGIGVVDWNNLEPIELTEEWLIKFEEIKWLSKDIGGYFLWFSGKKIYIKFVHSLQNMYFCIEEKELTYEEI